MKSVASLVAAVPLLAASGAAAQGIIDNLPVFNKVMVSRSTRALSRRVPLSPRIVRQGCGASVTQPRDACLRLACVDSERAEPSLHASEALARRGERAPFANRGRTPVRPPVDAPSMRAPVIPRVLTLSYSCSPRRRPTPATTTSRTSRPASTSTSNGPSRLVPLVCRVL